MRMERIILLLIILSSCVNQHEEGDTYSGLPIGDDGIIILRQEHTVEGTGEISRVVEGKFNRINTVTDDILIETDTLMVGDILTIYRKTNGRVTTKLYAKARLNGGIYEHQYVNSYLSNYENSRTYNLK